MSRFRRSEDSGSDSGSDPDPGVDPVRLVGAVAAVLGGILLGFAIRTSTGAMGPRCDGCAPFHPLFVLAPAAVGAVLVVAGVVVARR